MDCIQAQQVLSEAMDGQPTTPELLDEARAHCAACSECARFAEGLELLRRAQPPVPPVELHDRIMSAVSAEASAADAATRLGQRAELVAAPTQTSLDEAAAPGPHRRPEQWKVAAWVGAAALVLVVIGFAAIVGLRGGAGPEASRQTAATSDQAAPPQSLGTAPGGAAQDATKESSGTASGTAPQAAAKPPNVITLDSIVYASVPASDYAASQLTTLGTTTTSLDRGGTPAAYAVYATPVEGRIVVIAAGETLMFEVVTRNLKGGAYRLTSKPIESFGVWPDLPSGFTHPTTADGAPTFVNGTVDDLGVQTYINPGTPIEQGFAVAPGTAATDPARGNPNWTWWTRAGH